MKNFGLIACAIGMIPSCQMMVPGQIVMHYPQSNSDLLALTQDLSTAFQNPRLEQQVVPWDRMNVVPIGPLPSPASVQMTRFTPNAIVRSL